MNHPVPPSSLLDPLHGQTLDPRQQGRVLPHRLVINHLNVRTLDQARDLPS